jgi:NADPH-dependent glutamate synthase beta subunit-like oxidoreductase
MEHLDVNPDTWQTSIPFIFSAGDAATGPSLVVEAIGGEERRQGLSISTLQARRLNASPANSKSPHI